MTRAYSAAQVRAAEASLIAAGEPLMARAASGLAREIRAELTAKRSRVLLLVGSGDNGGDALFAGAELAAHGIDVAILRTGSRVHEAGFAAAVAAGAMVVDDVPEDAPHLIVDGMLGTGTSAAPALRGRAREVVIALRPAVTASGPPVVVAVDLPSGIHPDTGATDDGMVLPATVTVTFGALKTGLLRPPGSELAGEVRLIDIGLLPELERLFPSARA